MKADEHPEPINDQSMTTTSSVPKPNWFRRLGVALPARLQSSRRSTLAWWLLAWLFGFAFAYRIAWSALYLVCSMLAAIALNLGDRRSVDEPSAYSVFNRNFERIAGTELQQPERMIRGGR